MNSTARTPNAASAKRTTGSRKPRFPPALFFRLGIRTLMATLDEQCGRHQPAFNYKQANATAATVAAQTPVQPVEANGQAQNTQATTQA